VEEEEFFFEYFFTNIGLMSSHIGAPHFQGFPFSEFCEESKSFNIVIVVSFLDPLFHGHEIGRLVGGEQTKSFFTKLK
jgi:hypothetical protein